MSPNVTPLNTPMEQTINTISQITAKFPPLLRAADAAPTQESVTAIAEAFEDLDALILPTLKLLTARAKKAAKPVEDGSAGEPAPTKAATKRKPRARSLASAGTTSFTIFHRG